MTFLLNQLILAFWNFINSRIDAYRILKNKIIAHGVNFIAYAIVVGVLILLFKMSFLHAINFCLSAFANRQLSFDLLLNIRRKLPWFYQSTANPPKAWWDKVERKLFGVDYNGKTIAMYYAILFIFTLVPEIIKW